MTILAERSSSDPRVTWQARVSPDRGRLSVVAVIQPSDEPIVVELPTELELKELLAPKPAGPWQCTECGAPNDSTSCWCRRCSSHLRGER
jgi:hypothetical protein